MEDIKSTNIESNKYDQLNYVSSLEEIDTRIKHIHSLEEEIVYLVNKIREKKGLSLLIYSSALSNVARLKSEDMQKRQYFSHVSTQYGSPFDMMSTFKITFSYGGENLAMGHAIPQDVVNQWMYSPAHRKNILSVHYTEIGVGCSISPCGTFYWTQMFICPKNKYS